jgi:hypothetical protein
MTNDTQTRGLNPFDEPLDRILAEIAFSIQLPPSLHQKAVERYEAVRKHLESTSSLFRDDIEHFYPQGSMAIDATISTRGTDDEYDLDIVAQLGDPFRRLTPLEILKTLERGLVGYRGLKVVRQTRCVTLFYSDNMHLDITPSLRNHGTPDRQSWITHAKGPLASPEDCFVPMNGYGFADWYTRRTPTEQRVLDAFQQRWKDRDGLAFRADADVDDVPAQTQFVVKNTATLALQLLKRFRNIRYADRAGRMPPSVVLAYFTGLAARPGMRLSDMLIRISNWIIGEIEIATTGRKLLHVENPAYPDDVFTDRWPENFDQQVRFARDLKELVVGLERIRDGKVSPDGIPDWLRDHFGSRVVTKAVDRIADLTGQSVQSGTQGYTRSGRLILPASVAAAAVSPLRASAVPGTKHTFFGEFLK